MTDHENHNPGTTRETVGEKTKTTRDSFTTASPYTVPGFFRSLKNGYLLAGVCKDCGTVLLPPRNACYTCGGRSIVVEDQPKTGAIVSYTEVRNPPAGFDDGGAYTVGVVEIDSGGRLPTRIAAPIESVSIGDRVRLRLDEEGVDRERFDLENEREWPMFVFEPIEDTPMEMDL
jgi:uncharacterized OB-fold protein